MCYHIIQEHFREPKILPCLHYFCKVCIQQLALAHRQQPFPCPECHSSTVLPQNDPERLPTAFFVDRMKELHANMEKAEGKVEVDCEMCSRSKAEAFCCDCTDFICNDCVKSHQIMKVFAGHQVMTLEELRTGGAKKVPLKVVASMLCQHHDEQLKIYCFDCNRLICRDCVVYDHSDHSHKRVRTAAPQCRKMLTKSLASLKKAQSAIAEATKEIEATEAEVSAQCSSVSNTIEQSFDQIIELLRQRMQQLLGEVCQVKEEKLDALSTQKTSFQSAHAKATSLVQFTERSLEYTTDEELMSIHKQVLTRVEEASKTCGELDLECTAGPDVNVDVPYCAESVPLNLGSVYLATAQGMGLKTGEVGKTAQVVINIATCQKQPCINQKVEAELKSVVDGSVVHASIVEKDNGIYEATYTPTIRGRHTLNVRVNKKTIAGSPFQLFMKIHPTQLGQPVRVISGVKESFGIAFNSKREQLLVRNVARPGVLLIDKDGNEVQAIVHDDLKRPCGVTVDKDENVYVTDNTSDSLLKFSRNGEFLKSVSGFSSPRYVKVVDERVYISEFKGHRVQILDRNLEAVGSFGSHGRGNGEFDCPEDIAQAGAHIYVADFANNRIQVFDLEGHFVWKFQRKDSETVDGPTGLCFDACSEFLYVNEYKGCVSVFRPSGEFVTSFGEMSYPAGITIDDDGFVYACASLEDTLNVF